MSKKLAEETRLLQIAMEYGRAVKTQFEGIVSMDDEIEEVEAAIADSTKHTNVAWLQYVVG